MSSDKRIETSFIPSGVSSAISSLKNAYLAYLDAEKEAHKAIRYSNFNSFSIKNINLLANKITEIVYSISAERGTLSRDAQRFRRCGI